MENLTTCFHCEGKGYTELRDCSGDIQRTERCSFCEGLGYLETEENDRNSKSEMVSTVDDRKIN